MPQFHGTLLNQMAVHRSLNTKFTGKIRPATPASLESPPQIITLRRTWQKVHFTMWLLSPRTLLEREQGQ